MLVSSAPLAFLNVVDQPESFFTVRDRLDTLVCTSNLLRFLVEVSFVLRERVMGVRTMPAERVTLCLAVLLLILDLCGAFVVPTTFGTRAKLEDHHSLLRSSPRGDSLKMALSGLPSKSPRRKRPWEDDLVTTIGRAAFSSFKDKARDMMVKGAEKRGLDWTGVVNDLKVTNYPFHFLAHFPSGG